MATKPTRCTNAMWQFWLDFQALEPTVQLGGIYASKPGYHNYRDALPKNDYSVQLQADREGPGDMAAAIDLTFPDAQSGRYETIIKYASRLLASGKDLNDPRGNYLREFYGQADADTAVEGWDFQYLVTVTSDSSHLWHLHLSFLRKWLNDPAAYAAVLAILRGDPVNGKKKTVGEFLILTDGPNAGKWHYSNYVTMRPVDEVTYNYLVSIGAGIPTLAPGKFSMAEAARVYGTPLASLDQPGPPGSSVLVPHTHESGPAVPTT